MASSPFANDDGSIEPQLQAAFESGEQARIIAALSTSRVITAVVESDQVPESDCDDNIGTVMIQGADGRKALLAFSSTQTLAQFDPQARPMPLFTTEAARAAQEEGAQAIVLDHGTENFTVVEGDDFIALAAGQHLIAAGAGFAWVAHPES